MTDWITGREVVCAVGKAATWRTPVAVGALDGVLITSESMGAKAPTFLPDDSLGQADIKNMIQTNQNAAGSLEGYLRYEGWDLLMALALGTTGTPSQEEGTAYSNTLSPADSIAGYFATMAMKKANSTLTNDIWEFPTASVTGFTISGEVGGLCKISVNVMANKLDTQSTTNTATQIGDVTYPTSSNIIRFDTSTKFRCNTQSGIALEDSSEHIIYPFGFELTYNRPFKENWEAGYTDMSEPVQDGFAEANVRLNFDKYGIDTFMSAIAAETDYKMDIDFIGSLITGTSYYQFRIDIPKVTFTSAAADVGGPGTIPHSVEGRCLGVDSAPNGMSGVTDPISIYTVNTVSTDPLA